MALEGHSSQNVSAAFVFWARASRYPKMIDCEHLLLALGCGASGAQFFRRWG